MFRRNREHEGTHVAPPPRQGFFSRFRSPHPADQPQYNLSSTTHTYGPQSGYGVRQYYRDPYYEGSTRSDWDHYAVRHEEALIGDPVPIMRNNLNLAANQALNTGTTAGPYGPGPLANGPVNHGYDDRHYDRRHPAFNNLDKHGAPLVGPVTANGPLPGNYASGVVVEKNFVRGPGAKRSNTGMLDDPAYQRGWQSAAWGAAPLYEDDYGYGPNGGGNSLYTRGAHETGLHPGSGPVGSTAWGSAPLYGYRDSRMVGRATPLLPDNPWTHNELGRDWEDGYRRGTIPYSSINNAFVQPAVTENFVDYGPNGERVEGYRTRVVREDIVPPTVALGQVTTSNTTKSTKDVVTPGLSNAPIPVIVPSHPIPADAIGIPISGAHPVEVVRVVPTTTVVEQVVRI